MEKEGSYALIGAVMLGGIICAILGVVWLGTIEREYDEYEVVFEQKISGLAEGANVLFNGIRVGEVADLYLDRNDPNRSIAVVQVEKETPVKTDTGVELELVGVTGLAVIQFNGGSAQAPLLKAVDPSPRPVIEADLSGIAAVIDSSGDIALNIQRLISQENAESITRILRDVESLTDVLADKETEVALIVDNLAVASGTMRRISEQIEGTLTEVDAAAKDVRAIINRDGGQALDNLNEATANLNLLLANMNGLVEDNRLAIDSFAQQGLGATSVLVTNANRLVGTVEAMLLEFERDPARFLFGDGRPTTR